MIHVVVCSPMPALRAGLRAMASGDPGVTVDLTVASLAALPEFPAETGVLIATQGALGEDDLARLEEPRGWAVLLVSDDLAEAELLLRAVNPGEAPEAWGMISPSATPEALQTAVRALDEGLAVLPPPVLMALTELRPLPAPAGLPLNGTLLDEDEAPPQSLTGRETDVLRLAAQGLTNKQIAYQLGISEHTVKFHISAIYGKLGVSNRAEAVRKGARWGWVPL